MRVVLVTLGYLVQITRRRMTRTDKVGQRRLMLRRYGLGLSLGARAQDSLDLLPDAALLFSIPLLQLDDHVERFLISSITTVKQILHLLLNRSRARLHGARAQTLVCLGSRFRRSEYTQRRCLSLVPCL